MNKKLSFIPKLLSSIISIAIFIFLFFYLFLFPLITMVIPALEGARPSDNTQLVLGNYTNVLSALGASLAAGSGAIVHSKVKEMKVNHDHLKQSHDEMKTSIAQLHDKLDALSHSEDQDSDH